MFALIAIFIFVPIAELYVILKVGDAIGWLPTLAILVADSLLGTALMRMQGRAVWRRFQEAMQAGRMPHREVIDGALVIFGGAFLITPGFLTDIIGIALLLPPTRGVIRRLLVRRGGRLLGFTVGGGRRGGAATPPADWDVDGTAVEHDPPQLER
jgi:UPF0716 protein FxsA